MRIALSLVLVLGCAASTKELKQEVKELRQRLEDVARTSSALRSRIEDVDSRLMLLQDELETQKMAAARGARFAPMPPPSLPVVRLVPPAETDDDTNRKADGPSRPVASRDKVPLESAYQELDENGRVVERAPRGPRRDVEKGDQSGPISAYQAAYALYEQGRIREAMDAFRAFVARYPQHAYADNAQYWIGECYYDLKDWAAAKREFMKVVTDHTEGNKVPDAMLKVGMCARMMGREEEARNMFDAVVLSYPSSAAAGVALKLLGEMR